MDEKKRQTRFGPRKPVYSFIKRAFDIVVSLFSMIVLSPFFLIIAIAIKAEDGGPVFFRHNRVGRHGKEIGILKFRSMVPDAEARIKDFTPEQLEEFKRNFKLEGDPRITRSGKFLRKTSLDELPQLLNILLGNMSVVGPRPVTEEETRIFGAYRDLLLSVRPGLTGYWAAYGRGELTSYRRRRAMEIFYVKHRSLALDIEVIFKTVFIVFRGEGAR